jgi:hypothetical protein
MSRISRLPIVIAALIACATGHTRAAPPENDVKISGYGKFMLVVDNKKGGRPDQSTQGFGGRLGIETGEFHGFRLKAAGYTTSDFGLRDSDPRKTDAFMFDVNKKPYSILGEAQLDYRHGNTTLIAGRQEFFSPIINSYEYRIIPNLFEAVTLKHRLADSTATIAYVSQMSGLDGLVSFSKFRSMSQQAYLSMKVDGAQKLDAAGGDTLDVSRVVGHHGVLVVGIADDKSQRYQIWNFYNPEVLNTLYLDGRWQQALTPALNATIEGQTYRVNEVGRFKEYLAQQGLNARYALVGLKGTLAHQPSGISLGLAFNRFSGDRNTVTSFGNWGGYPEFVSMPYLFAESSASAIAQSRLSRLTVLVDMARFGLPGHSLLAGHAKIDLDESILSNSDITVNTLLYRAKLSTQLSARIAFDARQSKNSRYDNSFLTFSLRYDF